MLGHRRAIAGPANRPFSRPSIRSECVSPLTANAETNHAAFVERVTASGLLWGLKSGSSWAVCESNEYEDTLVYPFWSDESEARRHCTGDWQHFEPASVELSAFIEHWLPGMHEDQVLVGTNWDADLAGLEWEPLELAQQLADVGGA
jgi:hypothetical protein